VKGVDVTKTLASQHRSASPKTKLTGEAERLADEKIELLQLEPRDQIEPRQPPSTPLQ
jgi:hypothetical protein